MRLFIIILLSAISIYSNAQQALHIKTTGGENKNSVAATILIKGTTKGYSSDTTGTVSISFLANGNYTLVISAVGYVEKQIKITIPHSSDTFEIELESEEHEMEEVVIQSTRTSRTIANVPTRVETIEFEEIDEKNNMRPGNVAMLLHESTGIQVQQTSATSGNASIRIQGLDGRYTQLLKDGFASFGNFSSGLSVLEIPPLDLKQVEIIKGPASPLFGGGAIAGVINFISKTPRVKSEYNFIVNHSNIGQTNIGGFASARGKKVGYTLLALYNRQKPYDVDKDEFTEVPKSKEFTIYPKLFVYPDENTTITIGNSVTSGERTGGDIQVIKNKADASHQYFEKNRTFRNITTLELDKKIGDRKRFVAKQSFSIFDRTINIPAYNFAGIDYNSYTDISYVANGNKHALVLGGNFIYNSFREKSTNNRNNTSRTGGLYGQHTWDATDKVKLESGLRIDVANYKNVIYSKTEVFVLPRISLLVKYSPKWSSRIGIGMGYKTPTLFTEETETIHYRNVVRLNNVKSETSYGGTADVNFRTNISDDFAFSLNHMLFYTWINNPLVLENFSTTNYRFVNANKPVQSLGFETNARFIYKNNFKLFLGYTFTDTKAKYLTGTKFLPLVPKSKLNSALIYEKAGVIKLGLEGYFTGRQYLSNGTHTPAYSEFGFMAEKIFKKFSLYANFENFTDTRQSKYKNVVNGSHLNPTFDEIWIHTEGFVVNGGIKLKL
ncbi:MAG: TonB-dependent receptor [Chitinophagaceae bacterium]|nr:TonB-dependent receptor [Chitinophagaceae bacterium]